MDDALHRKRSGRSEREGSAIANGARFVCESSGAGSSTKNGMSIGSSKALRISPAAKADIGKITAISGTPAFEAVGAAAVGRGPTRDSAASVFG